MKSRRLLALDAGSPVSENLATDLISKPILSECEQQTYLECGSQETSFLGQRKPGRRALFGVTGITKTETKSSNTSGCSPMDSVFSPYTLKKPSVSRLLKKQVSCDFSLPVTHESVFRKVHSASEAEVVKALDREEGEDLVGDFSRSHCLPFIKDGAKHTDLKSITHSTVSWITCSNLDQFHWTLSSSSNLLHCHQLTLFK